MIPGELYPHQQRIIDEAKSRDFLLTEWDPKTRPALAAPGSLLRERRRGGPDETCQSHPEAKSVIQFDNDPDSAYT